MAIEIRVPAMGESVTEATIARWIKKVGEAVNVDEPLVELETDKVTLEVAAPASGVLKEINFQEEATVEVGALLGLIEEGAIASAPKKEKTETLAPKSPQPSFESQETEEIGESSDVLSPAVRKLVAENNISPDLIKGTGKNGRITKEDVLSFLKNPMPHAQAPASSPASPKAAEVSPFPTGGRGQRSEERVRMSRLRQRIAERLKDAQNTAAILTTFNEVDMTQVMNLRQRLKDDFAKKYDIKLGFMSFFVKACCVALKEIPAVNARIEGSDIVYHHFCDIGVAVGTPQGLVVPIVRNADQMSFAEIEAEILNLALKARDGKLSLADMSGGTFTISNGGTYGSLMSTPILNPPQSGILGMHKIQKRPMVIGDEIKIRSMMYLALSYDHRVIDGKEAVTFLVRIKEMIEDPERMLLGM